MVRKGQPVYEADQEIPGLGDPHDHSFRTVAILPFAHEGKIIGSLHLGSHTHTMIPPQSRVVLETVVAQAAGAIGRIRGETERQRLERQILEISDREQARIGQELHDGLCQQLVSLAFDANSLQSRLAQSDRPEAELASRIAQYLDDSITEARHLSRGLFPIRLQAEGLVSALQELARGISARFGIYCIAVIDDDITLRSDTAAIHIYRIAQEAVTNAVKHGHAKTITIRLASQNGELRLEVADDGSGLSADNLAAAQGMGLHIMDYRARSIGGSFHLSRGKTKGSSICCCIPSPASEKIST
jgi:signal transduction histidine kinase